VSHLRARLSGLRLAPSRETEIVDELSQHLDDRYEELRAAGVSDAEARRLAIAELDEAGGLTRRIGALSQAHAPTKSVEEPSRSGILHGMGQDLRYVARTVRGQPGFALTIVATLALGIAVNTTVFTIVNGVVFRPLPFDDARRIVELNVKNVATGRDGELSYLEFRDWQSGQTTLEPIVGTHERSVDISGDGRPAERVVAAFVSWNTFSMLGRQPVLGRDFYTADDGEGASPVVIIGWRLWQARYDADRAILGRTIRVNGAPSTVVGVMPQGFGFPYSAEFWLPLNALPAEDRLSRTARVLDAFGRLRPGVTIEQATADLAGIAASLTERYPQTNGDIAPLVAPFGRAPAYVAVMVALLGAVGFVLLIACANVSNLLLARAAEGSRDIALRIALGASRWRIVRQLLTESLALAAAGGVCGVALSYVGVAMFTRALAENTPAWLQFPIDRAVLTYVVVLCVISALVCSLVPAWNLLRTSLSTLLQTGGPGRGGSRRQRWTGGLVVAQVALALVLLTGAMLMMRNLIALMGLDVGVETSGLSQMQFTLEQSTDTPERRRMFLVRLEEGLASSAGVNATLATDAPLSASVVRRVRIEGPPEPDLENPAVSIVGIGQRYFDVIGARVIAGRTLTATEIRQSDDTVVVNERFARMHFEDGLAVGERIRIVESDAPEHGQAGTSWMTIVGVIGNVRQRWPPYRDVDPVVYRSYAHHPPGRMAVLARSTLGQDVVAAYIADHVRTLDPDLPILPGATVAEALGRRLWLQRLFGPMFTVFASIALLLAVCGLYAVTAYAVSRRTREIGVRVALGADARRVCSMVMATTLRQLGIGLVLGLAGAAGVARILPGILVGPDDANLSELAAVIVLLSAAGLLATAVPARRALRIDPTVTLQAE
jgi:predicted permease